MHVNVIWARLAIQDTIESNPQHVTLMHCIDICILLMLSAIVRPVAIRPRISVVATLSSSACARKLICGVISHGPAENHCIGLRYCYHMEEGGASSVVLPRAHRLQVMSTHTRRHKVDPRQIMSHY